MEIGEVQKKTRKNSRDDKEQCPSCSCGSGTSSKKLPSLRQVLGLPKIIPDNAESGPGSPTLKDAPAALSPAIPYAGSSTNAGLTGALYPYYSSHKSELQQVDNGRSLPGAASTSYSPAYSTTAARLQDHPVASSSTSNTYGYNDIAATAESQRYRPPSWLLKRQEENPAPIYVPGGQVDRDVDMNVVDEPESYQAEESAYQGDQDAELGMDEPQQQEKRYQDGYDEDESERYRRYRRGDGNGEAVGAGGEARHPHPHPQKRSRTSSNGEDPGSLLPLLPLPFPVTLPHSHSPSSNAYHTHRSPVISVNSPVSSHQHSPTLSLPLSLPLPLSSSSSDPTTAAPTPALRDDVSISPSAAGLPPLALALNPDIVQTAHLLASIAELGVRSPLSNPALSVTGSASRTTSSSKSSSSAAKPVKARKAAGTGAGASASRAVSGVGPATEKQPRSDSSSSSKKTKSNNTGKRPASTSPRASNDLNQQGDAIPMISATAASPQQPLPAAETESSAAAAASLLSALALPSYISPVVSSKPMGLDDHHFLDHSRGSSLTLPFADTRHLQSPLVSSSTGTATTDSASSSYFAFSSPAASASTSSIPRQAGRGAGYLNSDNLQGSHDTTPEDRHSTIMEEDEEDQDEVDEGDEEYDERHSQNGGYPPAESVGSSSGAGGGAGSSSSTGRYACTVCNKYFSRPSALAVHSHMHTGEKPFTCTICHRSFSVNSNLKRHLKTHSKAPSRKML